MAVSGVTENQGSDPSLLVLAEMALPGARSATRDADVSLVVVAVDDHRPVAVELVRRAFVELLQRDVDRAHDVLLGKVLRRQHLDELSVLLLKQPLHLVPVDRSRHYRPRSRLLRCKRKRHFVDVTPTPVLARLGGANDRMAAFAPMSGRMLVRRRVAASDLPARHAHAQMYPAASDLQALLTAFDVLR